MVLRRRSKRHRDVKGVFGLNMRVHLLIEGRVQGVFFRRHTREKAIQNGLRGWVRNLPDGRVEAVFEGDDLAVRRIVEFCRVGPRGSHITRVEVIDEKYLGEYGDFSILY
jgi:acylphosphatase